MRVYLYQETHEVNRMRKDHSSRLASKKKRADDQQ